MTSAATASAGGLGGRSKFPFTATQWQELEHQALVYKYMSAGIPIPPDLLSSIKRSLYSSNLFPYPPSSLGWNPYQMGYGKKIDPEPGRCRRTDGKKWRCSKEAYPDSKYCERHMHRGKNRSRKPVENNTNINSNNITINNTNSSTFDSSSPVSLANTNNNLLVSTSTNNNNNSSSATYTHHSLLSTPKTHPSSLYSFPSSDTSYNSPYSFSNKDYSRERYIHGLREEVGEHAFFGENSGSTLRGYSTSSIDESWPLGGSSGVNLDQSKHGGGGRGGGGGYPNYLQQIQSSNNSDTNTNDHTKQQQEKQCYIWGRDFNCGLSMKVEEERDINSDKTIHHFFDEWPLKTNGGANDGRDSSWHDSSSTTHLSISIPTSTSQHDFFLSNSRSHHDV